MSQTNQLLPTCKISFTSTNKTINITVLESDCVQVTHLTKSDQGCSAKQYFNFTPEHRR